MIQDSTLPPDTIVTVDGETARAELCPDAGQPCFDGHFPENPVVPAIAQVGWTIALAEALLERPLKRYSLRRYKFKRPLRPGDAIQVVVRRAGKGLKAEIRLSDGVAASGDIFPEGEDV